MHEPRVQSAAGTTLAYRPDIDGLRALAVLAVVIFHFSPSRLAGGFVGVDVFFVISGFLISGIIMDALNNESFSYWEFYARRIRRILPTLILILIATMVLGFSILLPDEHWALAKEALAGSFFSYNFMVFGEAGYFEASAGTKRLLHLWSLGIEEQFYIVWPLLLALTWRSPARRIIVVLLAVGSFVLNVALVYRYPSATFYLPFTRFWELLIGCLLAEHARRDGVFQHGVGNLGAVFQNGLVRNAMSLVGMCSILASMVLFRSDMSYPGWYVAVPTLGTALVIAAGPGAFVNKSILSLRMAVFIGLISYPLYMWHWPALYWSGRLETHLGFAEVMQPVTDVLRLPAIKVLALVVAAILAYLTYVLVEKPIRRLGRLSAVAVVLLMTLTVCLPAYLYIHLSGKQFAGDPALQAFLLRYSYEQNDAFKNSILKGYRMDCSFLDGAGRVAPSLPPSCYTASGNPVVMLWGDSHAAHLRPGLDVLLQTEGSTPKAAIIQLSSGSCVLRLQPINKEASAEQACDRSNELALKTIAQLKPDVLILTQANDYFQSNWTALIAEVRKRGAKQVIVVGPVPRWRDNLPATIAYRYWPSVPLRLNDQLRREFFDIDRKLKQEIAGVDGVIYVSAIDYFCNAEGCLVSFGDDRLALTSWDGGHLTPRASQEFVRDRLAPNLSFAAPATRP